MTNRTIPETWMPIVLEKASRLYQEQQKEKAYSLEELTAAGSEVQIPPELMQQAYEQLQQEQADIVLKKAQVQRNLKLGGALAIALSLVTALWIGRVYNSLSVAETVVEGKWAQVENQMQRRADLIPQLTQVTESFVSREENIIDALSAARADFLTATTVAERSAANEEMKGAIAQFQTFAASHQQLQSSQLFINLQYEIAGTENRIATERMRYNQAVGAYNQSVKEFPRAIAASILGFEQQPFLGD
ncbi:MAG: LemA family protein [Phormidesmis sp.]